MSEDKKKQELSAVGSNLSAGLGGASLKVPLFCDRGTMVNMNLPSSLCNIGWRVDSDLAPGTLEVWQDGKRIGRIENIGVR